MPSNAESRSLAVLIDADNTSPRYSQAIFEEIVTLGEANVRRIYGDFSEKRLIPWDKAIQSLAILQHQQRSNTTGKNASDIALVIDAMDLMFKGKLDGFCLVSSDSDFTRLAQRLREEGMVVYGFGEQKTPEAFRNACTRFIYVENLMDTGSEEKTGRRGIDTHAEKGSTEQGPETHRKRDRRTGRRRLGESGACREPHSGCTARFRSAKLWLREPEHLGREIRRVRYSQG